MKLSKVILFTYILLSTVIFSQDIIVKPIEGISESFIRGVDISMLAQIEEKGGLYYDFDGQEKDLFVILKENGINWIRLRLWNDPINHIPVIEGDKIISNKGSKSGGGNNDLETTLALAKRAKQAGFKLLLDFHYSDFWADPGKQNKPWKWKNLDVKELNIEIYNYTKNVIQRLKDQETSPDMVQIGNELNNGMLWPEGQIWPSNTTQKVGGMDGFIQLLKSSSKAVREVSPKTKIAIHLADGGNNNLYREIFDPITDSGLDFDVIGLSFYPYWHGAISDLSHNLIDLSKRYQKELLVMETAYGFTTEDGDNQGNVFKVFNNENGGYLPTVQGQATVVRDVLNAVSEIKGGLGAFYWEPAWIPVTGAGWRTGEGSSWENQAMFDYKGNALPSLKVFKDIYGKDVRIEPKGTKSLKILSIIGEDIVLPTKAEVIYSDDSWSYADVVWNKNTIKPLDEPGNIKIVGKLKDLDLDVELEIQFTNIINLVKNNSFETGDLEGWTISDPQSSVTIEENSSNALTGNCTYKYWNVDAFKTMVTQKFSDIKNGEYTLKCQAMGGGGEKSIYLFARDFGNNNTTSVTITNSGWQEWKEYSLPNIEVTNNRATIGLFIAGEAGNWANYDDFEFYLNTED